MEHHTTTSRAEAERLLGVSEKLLREKDYAPCKDFALLAQETEPLLEGPEQILAIAEVLLASNNKKINNQHDWYSILQIHKTDDFELIKKQYRRLALLLHPDKNKYPCSDVAFGLVADAFAVLSDPNKKTLYDNELALFSKVNTTFSSRKRPTSYNKRKADAKLPVRRSTRGGSGGGSNSGQNLNPGQNVGSGQESSQRAPMGGKATAAGGTPVSGGMRGQRVVNLWTACPYCYNLYEYPRAYEGCCLRCESCKRAFTAAEILSMPPLVPGREAYYCIWGFFPMGFVNGNLENGKVSSAGGGGGNGFPNWMPPMFPSDGNVNAGNQNATPTPAPAPAPASAPTQPQPQPQTQAQPQTATPASAPRPMSTGAKKRGRPRKYPQ